jgi:hypothetical protein
MKKIFRQVYEERDKLYNDSEECLRRIMNERNIVLRYLPDWMWEDADFRLQAVKAWGETLDYIPQELVTGELCIAAVTEDGTSLEFVPQKLHSEQLFITAVRQNGAAICFVPLLQMTRAIMREALLQTPNAVYSMHEDWRDDAKEFLKERKCLL